MDGLHRCASFLRFERWSICGNPISCSRVYRIKHPECLAQIAYFIGDSPALLHRSIGNGDHEIGDLCN
eukprot:scaffold74720_cov33-Attheya_sp.AAC.1